MTNNNITRLRTNPDFRFMVAPYTDKARSELKTRLLFSGCSSPIRVWDNMILVDYEIFDLCKTFRIPFKVAQVSLNCYDEAIVWICKNQLVRKDLQEKMRQYLIGKRFLAERDLGAREAAKGRRSRTGKMTEEVIIDTNLYDSTATKTCHRLGCEYHISFTTVRKYGVFAELIDSFRSKDPALVDKLLSEKIRISHESLVEISQLSTVEFTRLSRYFLKNGDSRPTYAKFRAMIDEPHKKEPVQPVASPTGTIKDMPAFDPDGEVYSLALTIPSWIGSIKRTQSVSDFSKVSESAGAKLIYELDQLTFSVEGIRDKLTKEVYHGGS